MKEHAPILSWAKAQAIAERFTRRNGVSKKVSFYDRGQNVQGTIWVENGKTKSKIHSIQEPSPSSFTLSVNRRGTEAILQPKEIPSDSKN